MPAVTALAYFITFTTYASRLPGDERGTVDRLNNGFDSPRRSDSPGLRAKSWEAARSAEVWLDPPMRAAVEGAITEHCAIKGWLLHALNVRTNHVHVVVSAENEPADAVMQQFKAWSTRRLRAEHLVGTDAKVWTRHGSTRYVVDEGGVAEVVDYVLFQQGMPLT